MLEGKVAFVTGAARNKGNGRAIALKLAGKGADVAVGDILYEDAQNVAEEIRKLGRNAFAVNMDLSKYDDIAEGFAETEQALGPVDILVNNAAMMTNAASVPKMKPEAWQKEIAINLSGAFFCVQQVFEGMRQRKWGRIINISSLAGMLGGFGQAGYSATKAGLIGLTKTLAVEGARKGITANVITLGMIGTNAVDDLPEKIREGIKHKIPMGRLGLPEEVASLVAFLSSDEADYITGANMILSGGADLGGA
jgi:NAD(P)-dependent dehydrogenase (short-subunit alcohol dehydrogenase family)